MTDDLRLVNVTPEHAFAFMLHDRIETLEDDAIATKNILLSIPADISSWIPYEWLNFKFQLPISSEVSEEILETFRVACVNSVFERRASYNPYFAYWTWEITTQNNTFDLHIYIRFGKPCSFASFDYIKLKNPNILLTIRPVQGGSSEMKMIIKDRLGYTMSFPYSKSDIGVEIWRKGGDGYDNVLDEDWSTDPFIFSKNYKVSVHEFYLLRDEILRMVQNRRWLELFHMDGH
jgi:hypothetical protein